MASGDKFYLADKATLDEVNGKIGAESDTGGSSSVGTVMAKENAVLTEVGKLGATNDAQSSSTTTGSIFAKLNYLVSKMISVYSWCSSIYSWCSNMYSWFSSRIGVTTETGGTTSTGTIMAKENAILTEVNKLGDTADTGATVTTGTMFGKLNEVMKSSLNTSARIVCCGIPGTQFVLSNPTGYFEPKIVEISDSSFLLPSGHRAEFVGVPLGTYSIKILLESLTSNTTTVSITADELGKTYSFDYMLEVQRFTSSGIYTFPAEIMYITAAGGGGGGGGGDITSRTYGGGGGGGGSCIYLSAYKKSVGFQTNITIGTGGSAGAVHVNGTAGQPTILSNLVTLSGGGYGTCADDGYGTGGTGGTGGGDGGGCYTYGKNSIIPTGTGGTSVTNTNNSGGGGGGGFGAGGNGGSSTGISGKNGGYGAGGGGGGKGAAGGAGGAGIVIFHLGFRQ